jgi:hypothetical protein
MTFVEWSKSEVDYGRKLVNSAVEGARKGEGEFLQEKPLAPYLSESARQALGSAVIGAALGVLGGYLKNGRRSPVRALASGFLGGAIGFGVGMIWDSRQFTESVALGAFNAINKTRDEHWFEKNPIDYA